MFTSLECLCSRLSVFKVPRDHLLTPGRRGTQPKAARNVLLPAGEKVAEGRMREIRDAVNTKALVPGREPVNED